MLLQGSVIVQALVDGRVAALTQMYGKDTRAALEAVFVPEDLSRILPKLPQSLTTAYNAKFQPGEVEIEAGLSKLGERAINSMKPTIGIPPFQPPLQTPAHSFRTIDGQPMIMMNPRRHIDPVEHRSLQQAYKKQGSTLPSFVYACLINSIDRRCQADTGVEGGERPGVHMCFSAHASRWLPKEAFMTRSPVNLGVVPGSAFLPADEFRSKQRGRDLSEAELFSLARSIRTAQESYLDSPHVISAMQMLGDQASSLVAETAQTSNEASPAASICPPTLTSQGELFVKRYYTVNGASDNPRPGEKENEKGDYIHFEKGLLGGRTTGENICFALSSYAGLLTLQAQFDSRFFDAELIDAILDDVIAQLRFSAHGAGTGAKL